MTMSPKSIEAAYVHYVHYVPLSDTLEPVSVQGSKESVIKGGPRVPRHSRDKG